MEFKFREIDDRTTPYRSSPSPSSQSSSYLSDQALRGNYSMDPNFLNNPRHFYTIQREIEKQIIRHEIITHEIITAEVERRRLLEEEVRRELMIEREMAMYRAREMGLSIDDRFSMQLHTSYPLMHQSNNCWLEDRFPFPWNPSMGFGHNGLPPNFLPHFSNGPWSGLEVNKKDKLIMLPKPDSNTCGSKKKAATPPAGSGELPSTNSNKPKEWSCALCQVSAPTERGLDEHLQGRKHKAKVAGLLRDTKRCSNSIPSTSKKSTESRDGVGQEMKTKIQEESVNQKVDGGLDEHPQGKKQKAKEEELLGAQKWIKKSTESRDSAGQEMKAKVEEESAKANRTVVGLDQKEEGCQAQQVKPYPNLCGSKQEAATLPAGSGELPLTSSKKPTDWSCALCQFSTTSKRDLDEHLQGRKHEAKEEGLPGDQKMCSNSTSRNSIENRDSAGEEIKATVEEESVKANKTVVGLDQKVEGGQDEHLQGKEHKAKEAKLIGAQTTSSSSTSKESGKTIRPESGFRPESAGQAIKAKVEEESVEAIKTVVGLDQKVEGEKDSENKNEELPKKDPNENTRKTTNGIPTAETMKRKLPLRENFEFWCEVCQVGTHSAVVMEGHKRGKKHMARSNEYRKNNEAVPLTTSTTIVTPSEPTENVEGEAVVVEESNEETRDCIIEKAEDEEVVVYRGR
ncbi:uncharacterized protein LOC102608936 isoform X3 [Citrus sinensis]|uniref:uncharacterized protein LOC102608936 isoform X3 n=1 Tax=Citrus sinensis TaxID=2711 RepID=UPI0022785D41|nr:uncharacterized protein LOC102608936 isoform X3 [Citrus sinensis]